MPKLPDSIGIKISELGDAGVIKENDVVPINAKTDAGVAFTKATKINDLRQTLGFDNAFLSVDAGLDATVSGDVFFVYETVAKLWVLQYQNVSGVANPVLGYDNNQVRLPTSRKITSAALVSEVGGTKIIPLQDKGYLEDVLGYATLEQYGADPSGNTDSSSAVTAAFNSGKVIYQQKPGIYRLDAPVIVPTQGVIFRGAGMSLTEFRINHLGQGIRIGSESVSVTKYRHYFGHFKITRPNYNSYTGTIGPKSLYISNSGDGVIEFVDEANAIGYGIQFDYSKNVTVRNCYVHDHIGGNTVKAGTDGIHFYRTTDITAQNNKVERVGDDAISCGSFDPNYPVNNALISDNKVSNTQAAFKLYTYVQNVIIKNNLVDTSIQSGVYLTNDDNSPNGAYIKNIVIQGNQFFNIYSTNEGNIETCPLRIRSWNTGTCTYDNIYFENNISDNCYGGINQVTSGEGQRISNLYVRSNTFKNQRLGSTNARYWINLQQVDNIFVLDNNDFDEGSSGAVMVNNTPSTITYTPSKAGRWRWTNNRGSNWNKSVLSGFTAGSFFWIRANMSDLIVYMVNNVAPYQYRTGTSTDGRFVNVNIIHPDSFFANNVGDGGIYFGTNNGGYRGPDKTVTDLTGAPGLISGTHIQGSIVRTTVPSATRWNEYRVVLSGTLDTISGTVTTTSGSRSVTFQNPNGLYEGAFISIAGATGTYRVVRFDATTGAGILDIVASATVTAAAIANVPPTVIAKSLI
ncbi:hypothetical protein MOC16_gp106 [Klebsiella phage vB_KpM_FBKp24]|uniref:Right handed beta helix domain-containing protein n=1 Tax=Klebsiella phage vB_KpM_FBKp24 TaxID=2801834 RepID=A0A7U0J707_9CAUD|nr:hypothetical protein MOC16_gp106 [Klebsiella phage vB_KpM_FBKp24]QQV92007.1 hypothetical protein vBKpMFBKp24_307 [Klebsiella phage vB_KpM_FBKp24]